MMEETSDFISRPHEQREDLLDNVEPLQTNGATCMAFRIVKGGKQYFMKRLRPEYINRTEYERLFEKEYNTGSLINHPHIVKYAGYGKTDGVPYILMEYVSGATLDEKLKAAPEYFKHRGHLDKFFIQLLRGLKHLHEQHLCYSDLKPQNIMLTRINNDVKIIDLGFCHTDSYTQTTGFTREFSAPEQRENKLSQLNERTDIYAIGRLIEYVQDTLDFKLPKVYQRIMSRCLKKKNEERWESVNDILELLNRRKRRIRRTVTTSIILLFLFIPVFLVIRKTNNYLELKELVTWALQPTEYDLAYNRVYYRITSRQARTCKVTGGEWHPNAMIESTVDINGQEYKVTEIENHAYHRAGHLQSVYLPEGIERIGAWGISLCRNISLINMPSTIKELGVNAFAYNENLSIIRLSPQLKSIPHGCFNHCPQIKNIHIPEGVTKLEVDAFACCDNLKEVVLPSTLTTIERGVFYECFALENIVIPANVDYIGEFAFWRCHALKDVYILAPQPPVVSRIFNAPEITVHLPAASVEKYRKAEHWKNLNIVAIGQKDAANRESTLQH